MTSTPSNYRLLTDSISDAYGPRWRAPWMQPETDVELDLPPRLGARQSAGGPQAQANIIYDFITPGLVDGLVLSSGVFSEFVRPHELGRYWPALPTFTDRQHCRCVEWRS